MEKKRGESVGKDPSGHPLRIPYDENTELIRQRSGTGRKDVIKYTSPDNMITKIIPIHLHHKHTTTTRETVPPKSAPMLAKIIRMVFR